MVVSAVVAGLTMITVGSVISSIQSQTFEPESTSYDLRYIEDEAERITSDGAPTQLERENYRKLVSELNYRSEVVYREDENCFDVYLTSSGEQYNLECLS